MEKEPVSKKPLKWIAALCVLALVVGACSNDSKSNTQGGGGSQGTTSGTGSNTGDAGLFPSDIVNQPVHKGTPKPGGTLTFGVESDILDVSPNANVIQPADVQMAYAVFDPLLTYGDPDDKQFAGVPVTDNTNHRYNQLADKITSQNNDLQHWTLTLRKGVKFSNGKPLTAQEVVDHTMWVKGSSDCACATNAANIESVTAEGDLTVKYTLKEKVVAFPTQITGTGLGWITESSARGDAQKPGIDQLVGAGPFAYQSKSGDSYTLVKNDNYYGTDPDNDNAKLPYLDKVIFQPLNDSVTRLQAVQSNSVQVMQTADTSNLVQAKKDQSLSVQPSEGSSSTILVLNLTHEPFGVKPNPGEAASDTAIRSLDDPIAKKSREAFNLSINRNEINQKYYKGARVPAYGFIPASSPWYDPKGQLPRTDVAKAKKLVEETRAAGVDPDVDALCINTPESSGIFQILKQQAAAVGVTAKLRQVEQSILVTTLLSGTSDIPWDSACFRSPQIADPDGVYGSLHSTGTTNLVKYNRPDVDKWLTEARETADRNKRKKLYDQVQEQVAKDVVYVPLLFDYYGNVFRNNVSGLSTPSPSSLGIIRPGTLYYTE
jgi:peptide/nickel transport system substrate-binding protein